MQNNINLLEHFLLALILIILLAKCVGTIFGKFDQPKVMGEVIAGILLGPSFFGGLFKDLSVEIFPSYLDPIFFAMAQLGIIIFMFLIGINLKTETIKANFYKFLVISHTSIFIPFFLGIFLAFFLYPKFAPSSASFMAFSVFFGASLSVTAFPVLARILVDLKISNSVVGNIAIACAAVDDVTAWFLLALAVGLVKSDLAQFILIFPLTILFVFSVKKIVPKMGKSDFSIFSLIFLAALSTEYIGIHALFGPFLLGVFIPKGDDFVNQMQAKLEPLTNGLLLPIFFMHTGMRTNFNLLNSFEHWGWCLIIVLAASFGKIGGAVLGARLTRISWRDAFGIGVLMNTKGLVELIVLNIGLDLNILSPTLFSMMVIMAIVTTLLTVPLFRLAMRPLF